MVGVTAKCNLDLLQSMAVTLNSLQGSWILGGDWNGTPDELKATGWLTKVGGIIFAPSAPTCNVRVLDVFVVLLTVDVEVSVSDKRRCHLGANEGEVTHTHNPKP